MLKNYVSLCIRVFGCIHVCTCVYVQVCVCVCMYRPRDSVHLVLETGSLIGVDIVDVTAITSLVDHNAQLFACVHPRHVGITSTCHP